MNRIKLLRMENGVKQAELAKYVNVAPNTLSNWETDKIEPSHESIRKIAKYFNTTTDYILGLTDDPASLNKKQKEPSTNEKAQLVYDNLKNVGIDLDAISEAEYKRLLLFIDRNRDLILERSLLDKGD